MEVVIALLLSLGIVTADETEKANFNVNNAIVTADETEMISVNGNKVSVWDADLGEWVIFTVLPKEEGGTK